MFKFMRTRRDNNISDDCTHEEFSMLLQHLYLTAPYSQELRGLRKFAQRHPNPEFQSTFRIKEELFERAQREFRPHCLLSSFMYSVERLLGRLLSSRALILAFVLAIATSIAVVFRYSHWENIFLRRNQTTDDVLDLLEAYAVRVEKSAEATTHSTNPSEPKASAHTAIEPDERFVHQLLISLEQPTVREHISRQLLSQTPDRPIDQTEAKAAEPVKSYTEHESEQSKTATVVHGGNTDQPAPRTSDDRQ